MKIFASINRWPERKAGLLACGLGLLAALAVQAQPILITTVAGYAGKGSTDGSGSGALFYNPQGVAVDVAGNVYVADTGNNTIRVINTSGVSSTLAGRAGRERERRRHGHATRFSTSRRASSWTTSPTSPIYT